LTNLFFQCSKIVVIVSTLLILLSRFLGSGAATNADMLAYTVSNYGEPTSLILYDLSHAIKTQVLSSNNPILFSLSIDGRLAYSSINDDISKIYLLDTSLTNHQVTNIVQTPITQQFPYPLVWSPDARYLAFGSPQNNDMSEVYLLDTRTTDAQAINITQMPATHESPVMWSPDGRYLAFVTYHGENPLLYIWNGETVINITPKDIPATATSYRLTWNNTGHLAFTVAFGYTLEDAPDEIYLWDGNKTVNLSQNPIGEDSGAVWSADGLIAFLSEHDGQYNIFVWDGVSFKDGSPDIKPFIDDPSGLIGYYSFPGWTPDRRLTFTSQTAADTNVQIYVWDGQTATNVSQNPTLHNGSPNWSNDERWAFVTYFSSQQLLYVRDAENRPLLMTEGQYSPAWSPSSLLMFCKHRWILSVWDSRIIIKITQGSEIYAKWSNGDGVACSSG
jgi:Tol biopolymer transport system component